MKERSNLNKTNETEAIGDVTLFQSMGSYHLETCFLSQTWKWRVFTVVETAHLTPALSKRNQGEMNIERNKQSVKFSDLFALNY